MTAGWARTGHGPWSEATFDHGPGVLIVHRPGHPQARLPIALERIVALDAIGPVQQGIQQVELALDNGAVLHAAAPRSFWEGLARALRASLAAPAPQAAAAVAPPVPQAPPDRPTPPPFRGAQPPPFRGALPPLFGGPDLSTPAPAPSAQQPQAPPAPPPLVAGSPAPPPYRGAAQRLFSPRAQPRFHPETTPSGGSLDHDLASHRPARRRRHPLRSFGLAALVLLALCTGDLVVLRARLDQFPAELPVLEDGVRTWLLVGTDSRAAAEGLPRPETYGTTEQVPGERADVVLVVQEATADLPARVVSVPRDLLVFRREHGVDRLALTLLDGPTGLATAICRSLGVAVDHVVTIRFDGIRDLIDRVGGIEVHAEQPMRDLHTGLELPAGTARLDGADALAWMRARHVEVQREGAWVPDPSSDTGRQERQRGVLEQLSAEMVRRARNPIAAHQLAWTTAGAVRADEGTGPIDLLRLAATLRSATERTSLPHDLLAGRIPVATLRPEAQEQLDGLRGEDTQGPPCPRPQLRSQ